MQRLYLDHNATAPVLPDVLQAMSRCWDSSLANPSSQHATGREARRLLEDSRESIAAFLGADLAGPAADRLIFTSGGTEANNLAMLGIAGRAHGSVVISTIEHPSVVGAARRLASCGWAIDRLEVGRDGLVQASQLEGLLRPDTRLVSVMLANNETGVTQPIRELAEVCARRGVPLHTDASQAAGKLAIDFRSLGVAALTISAHKWHGPCGIGALIVRGGTSLEPQVLGGHQELGYRAGTEPLPLILGLLATCDAWRRDALVERQRLRSLRDEFESQLERTCSPLVIHGRNVERLPQTSNISFVGVDRQAMFMALDLAGVACSTGSACASGSREPSPTLVAMGCDRELVSSAIRFSFGRTSTADDAAEAARRISMVHSQLRSVFESRKNAPPGRVAGAVPL